MKWQILLGLSQLHNLAHVCWWFGMKVLVCLVVSAACDDSEPLLFLVASSAQLQSISLPDPRGFLPTKFGPETLINCTDSHAPSGPSNAQKLAKLDRDSFLFPFSFALKFLATLYWLIRASVKCLYSLNLR